jgi:hypothetical protein
MKTDLIKFELMEWLSKVDDSQILTSLLQFKKSTESGDWSAQLTKEQLESLHRGLSEMAQGKVVSSDDFWNSIEKKD